MSAEPSATGNITRLLRRHARGDPAAGDALYRRVYDRLRTIARRRLRDERPGHTLQCTALVHEAFVRLAAQSVLDWQNQEQFYALASQSMRRILVDYARSRNRAKREGRVVRVALDERVAAADSEDILDLDVALSRLGALNSRQAKIVELRFFGGLDVPETAAVMGLSERTVKREWAFARAWLRRELDGSEQ